MSNQQCQNTEGSGAVIYTEYCLLGYGRGNWVVVSVVTNSLVKDAKNSQICYKTIFRKINTEETFLPFTIITNKDYFSRKKRL